MTIRPCISSFSRRLCVSGLLLLIAVASASAQMKLLRMEKDSIPMFRGFAVSFDVAGAAMLSFSDYGQYEAALRVNLHDEWFPVLEAGYGKARHDDEVTHIYYATSAPYYKLGVDRNLLKDKHSPNRLYAGVRYAFTNYKVDISRPDFPDPVWLWNTGYGVKDASCYAHWLEAVVGVDAKIFGPIHLGWNVKYQLRLAHKEGDFGNTWYVPGFGKNESTKMSASFLVIIDI